jgi:hypothetical protein
MPRAVHDLSDYFRHLAEIYTAKVA